MTIRPRFRPPAAMLAALGLLATPVMAPTVAPQSTVSQQQRENKPGGVPATQVPAPAVAIDRHAFMGYATRHPVWVARAKSGKGRKSGLRAKWDYRR